MTLTGILPVRHITAMFQGSLLAVLLPIFSNKSDLDPLTGVFGSQERRGEERRGRIIAVES